MPATTATAASCSFTVLPETMVNNPEASLIAFLAGSVADCEEACLADAACAGFDYFMDPADPITERCHLLNANLVENVNGDVRRSLHKLADGACTRGSSSRLLHLGL